MEKLRSVSTAIWSDTWFEDLTPSEKLLFIYLLTNDKTNMLGIYEISIKKISYDTGLNKDTIQKALKGFESVNKVNYIDNHVILLNFIKNQKFNSNMQKSAIDKYNNLPNNVKFKDLQEIKDRDSKGFERLCKGFGMVRKVEVEGEMEVEVENEIKIIDNIYFLYPSKCPIKNSNTGKSEKNKDKIKILLKEHTKEDLIFKINRYISDCKKDNVYIKNFSTFLNNLPDYTEQEFNYNEDLADVNTLVNSKYYKVWYKEQGRESLKQTGERIKKWSVNKTIQKIEQCEN